tara:strand:- start:939 stop:1178 length:240 start_codon:yes stop_codon:yes gene_type:complete
MESQISIILKGKSKTELINLFGNPDEGESTDIWSYNFGSSTTTIGLKFYSMKVVFENDKVSEIENHNWLIQENAPSINN